MVMPNRLAQSAASGPGTEEGRRPTVVPGPDAASPEVSERPRRRTFTVADKLRILSETDRASEDRSIGAILRREGLYSSTLSAWRRQRDAGAYEALSPVRRGPKPSQSNPLAADLLKENARLRRRLERAEAIIELQKKVAELLGLPAMPGDGEP